MNETLETCTLSISSATPNATSLQESGAGPTPSASRIGLTTNPAGPARVLASLSARQAKERGLMTSGTYGPHSSTSSSSASLQSSLGSKLPAKLDSRGSTLFKLTWKRRTTPQGRSIFALRASGLRTSVSVYSGVPTPCTPNGGRSMSIEKMDATGKTLDGRKHTASLEHVMKFSSVPTSQAHNQTGRSDHQKEIHGTKHGCSCLVQTAKLASTPTPTQHDAERGGQAKRAMGESRHGSNLQDFALLASTAPPAARDYKSNSSSDEFQSRQWNHPRGKPLSAQATLADSGQAATGGTAVTKSSGQLNPEYSRWLQGYKKEWGNCADTVTLLSRRSRRNS